MRYYPFTFAACHSVFFLFCVLNFFPMFFLFVSFPSPRTWTYPDGFLGKIFCSMDYGLQETRLALRLEAYSFGAALSFWTWILLATLSTSIQVGSVYLRCVFPVLALWGLEPLLDLKIRLAPALWKLQSARVKHAVIIIMTSVVRSWCHTMNHVKRDRRTWSNRTKSTCFLLYDRARFFLKAVWVIPQDCLYVSAISAVGQSCMGYYEIYAQKYQVYMWTWKMRI